ncbi:MAG: cohesin domain-containing protein [archaeon]
MKKPKRIFGMFSNPCRHSLIIIINISLLFFIFSCGLFEEPSKPPTDNPYDPDNPDYVPPTTEIYSGPGDGDTVKVDAVTFKWRGNQPECTFSISIDDETWSDWIQDTIKTMTYLDEDQHSFSIIAKYPTDETEESPTTISFCVDAVKGPALRFYKKRVETTAGNSFELEIWAEEVTDLAMASLIVSFDPVYVQIQNFSIYKDASAFLCKNGGNVIDASSYSNTEGKVTAYIARTTTNNSGVTGSGALLKLRFNAIKKGSTTIQFDPNCAFRKADNSPIGIMQKVLSLIVIK